MKSKLTVPSKVFIIGEYAVLDGVPALVATFAPRFGLGPRDASLIQKEVFHPDSPAGRLMKQNRWEGIWEFTDPYLGAGGFGGSTAEFLLAYAITKMKSDLTIQPEDAWEAWTRYREFAPLASGADLVAQWIGGTVVVDLKRQSAQTIDVDQIGQSILIFSAAHQEDRKVKTHEHLNSNHASFKVSSYIQLLVERAIDAFTRQHNQQLASAINQFGDSLRELGLEIQATTEDREAFMKVPGVIAVKGTGALQADGLVVMMDPAFLSKKAEVIQFAEARNLRCIARDLTNTEQGITVV
jgi:pantoate kinase